MIDCHSDADPLEKKYSERECKKELSSLIKKLGNMGKGEFMVISSGYVMQALKDGGKKGEHVPEELTREEVEQTDKPGYFVFYNNP